MLSRVADSLYWMSRYLERAEHTARVLDVNLHGLLDQKPEVTGRRWGRVLRSLCLQGQADASGEPSALAHRLTFDPALSSSIVSCVGAARQNAREVREAISTEMWEQVNRLYLQVQQASRAGAWDRAAHDVLQAVKERTHLFQGVTDGTMSYEEGWYFLQLGRYLERVQSLVVLLEAHFADVPFADDPVAADPYLEWVGLLKSCTAFEAYTRVHTANVLAEPAAAFLLLNPNFPHSVLFSVGRIRQGLVVLAETIPALKQSGILRVVGRLYSDLTFDPIEEILARDVAAYLRGIRERCDQLHTLLYDTCIHVRVARAV